MSILIKSLMITITVTFILSVFVQHDDILIGVNETTD